MMEPTPWTAKDVAAASVLSVAAAATRLWGLAAQSLWTDEIASVIVATKPFFEMLGFVALNDVNPHLFYVLLAGWLKVGQSDAFLRLLPVLLSVATVPVLYSLARNVAGRSVAFLAGALLAAHPFHTYYAQEVRYPALIALLALLSCWAVLRHTWSEGKSGGSIYVLVSILGCYAHYSFVFVLFAQVAWVVFSVPVDRRKKGGIGRRLALIGVLFAPGASIALMQFLRGNAAIKMLAPDPPFITSVENLFLALTVGCSPKRPPTFFYGLDVLYAGSAPLFWLVLIALTLPLLVALGTGLRRVWLAGAAQRLPVFWLGVPVVFLIVLDLIVPAFDAKFLVTVLPPVALIMALGLVSIRKTRPYLGTALIVAIFLLFASSRAQLHNDPRYQRDNWRSLAGAIERFEQPGDAVFNFSFELAYYYKGHALFVHPAGMPTPLFLAQDRSLSPDEIDRRAAELIRDHPRIWLRRNAYPALDWLDRMINQIERTAWDITPPEFAGLGPPVTLLATRSEVFKSYMLSVASPRIDFSTGRHDPRQEQTAPLGRVGPEPAVHVGQIDSRHAVHRAVETGHGSGEHGGHDQPRHADRQLLGDEQRHDCVGGGGRTQLVWVVLVEDVQRRAHAEDDDCPGNGNGDVEPQRSRGRRRVFGR